MLLKRTSLSLMLAGALLAFPQSEARAADTNDQIKAARQKINLSGRQRMLTQRLTSAVCLTVTGADPQRTEVAFKAYQDFDVALAGLKDGNNGLGLSPEPNMPIRQGIEVVEGTWGQFAPAVQNLLAGGFDSSTMNTILSLNTTLLSQSNDVVTLFEKTYGEGVIDPGTAVTINVAGRQRMLSQKMTKELCFIAADFDKQKHLDSLKGTVALFDISLGNLVNGNMADDIVPPPNTELVVQLGIVSEIWDRVKPRMQAVIDGGAIQISDLPEIAALTDTMLKEMHQAVLLYVTSAS